MKQKNSNNVRDQFQINKIPRIEPWGTKMSPYTAQCDYYVDKRLKLTVGFSKTNLITCLYHCFVLR